MNVPCGADRKAEGLRNRCKPPFAVVKEEHGLSWAHQHEILMSRIAQIDEERAGSIVEDIESEVLRDVPEMALSVVLIQAVGQTARLTDVDLVEAVAIDVGHGDSVLPVEVDAASGVQARPPVGGPLGELIVKRGHAGEGSAGHIAEPRLAG